MTAEERHDQKVSMIMEHFVSPELQNFVAHIRSEYEAEGVDCEEEVKQICDKLTPSFVGHHHTMILLALTVVLVKVLDHFIVGVEEVQPDDADPTPRFVNISRVRLPKVDGVEGVI